MPGSWQESLQEVFGMMFLMGTTFWFPRQHGLSLEGTMSNRQQSHQDHNLVDLPLFPVQVYVLCVF
jgi:hypothetical protein